MVDGVCGPTMATVGRSEMAVGRSEQERAGRWQWVWHHGMFMSLVDDAAAKWNQKNDVEVIVPELDDE